MEFEKIRDLIAEQFGVTPDSVTEDTAFKDLGDSMDLIELIMRLKRNSILRSTTNRQTRSKLSETPANT